ncbi:MAG: glycosyl hydrolase, partial [Dehalococcoidia bacterium]|nr:glycosyl hydrolase [Dehalococcoidia bacterium]
MIDAGRLFGLGDPGAWDEARVSCPVVRRESDGWRMWYYGREHEFPGGVIDGIPMGRTGCAVSLEGVRWTKVVGPGVRGSVLDPSGAPGAFDAFMVGGTDVVVRDDEYWLYYQGAHDGVMLWDGAPRKGFPLRIGIATARDGMTFRRHPANPVLREGAPGEWDDYLVGWPRLVALPDGGWRMYYNARGSRHPGMIGVAESPDGVRWEKRGPVFGPNPDPAAFDSGSVSTRHVIRWQGGYLMVYEAQPSAPPPTFRLGVAVSPDGLRWERLPGPGTMGCVLEGGPGDAWDHAAVGTPYLVPMPDGSIRLYYLGLNRQ